MAQTLDYNGAVMGVTSAPVPSFDDDLDIIQKLDDEPNDVGGMSAAELKEAFDTAGNLVKNYINNELVPAVIADGLTEEARANAEVERVANEQERVSNETTRVQKEAERENAETSRVAAEEERAAAEAARQETDRKLTDAVKPYTDYWWYAPGKGYQDGYEQKVTEGAEVELFRVACDSGTEFNLGLGITYGDSFTFDPATGRYSLTGDVGHVSSNARDILGAFYDMPRNKYVLVDIYTLAYVTDSSYLNQSSEYPYQDSFVEHTYTLGNATVYTRAPHAGDYISSTSKTAYANTVGYTLLGTVQEMALVLRGETQGLQAQTDELAGQTDALKLGVAQAQSGVDALTETTKPYTDYWWYAPGKGTQDGYEQLVEEHTNFAPPEYLSSMLSENGSVSEDDRIYFYYGDEIAFDAETGRYDIVNAARFQTTYANRAVDLRTLVGKYVSRSSGGNWVAQVTADTYIATERERHTLGDGSYQYVIYFCLSDATRYAAANHYGDYISTPDETTYEGVEGYTLLGTVADVAVDTRDEVRGMKEVRPDWNQDDETAADYIKNRPFYLNPNATTVIMPETYLSEETAEWDGMEQLFFFNLSEPIVVGKEYLVVINGTEYKATAFEETDDDLIDSFGQHIYIGNQKFRLRYNADGVMESEWNTAFGADEFEGEEDDIHGGVHCNPGTVSIAEVGEETVEIDSRYFAAIKAGMPRLNLTATFADGTTQTYNLYGEAVAE